MARPTLAMQRTELSRLAQRVAGDCSPISSECTFRSPRRIEGLRPHQSYDRSPFTGSDPCWGGSQDQPTALV